MSSLTDDPTSYLQRDSEVIAIVLGRSVSSIQDVVRGYGVSIQVNMAGNKGIRAVTSEAEALNVISICPPTTPWAAIAYDGQWSTYNILERYFGKPQTMAKALNVTTVGKAWRPDQMMV